MKKVYCLLMLGFINFGYGLGMYIESCSITYDEDWACYSFDCNFDYFIMMISGILILLFTLFYYQDLKKKKAINEN